MEEVLPREIPKPWGSELWFAHTDRYAGKILRVRAGCCLSVQYQPLLVHTLEAVEDSEIVEVSTPQVEDVVRLEDRYGRALRTASSEGD